MRRRTAIPIAAAALLTATLVGCTGPSNTQAADYLEVRDEYLTVVADVMALLPDAPWTVSVKERRCEVHDRFAPATSVAVQVDAGENAAVQGPDSSWPDYAVPVERQDALREQVAAIIADAGWFAQQWKDEASGVSGVDLGAATLGDPAYQAQLWIRFGVDGVSLRGESSCMPGDADALGDAARDQPLPWDSYEFDTPIQYQDSVF